MRTTTQALKDAEKRLLAVRSKDYNSEIDAIIWDRLTELEPEFTNGLIEIDSRKVIK